MNPSNISIHIKKAIIRVTPDQVPAELLKAQYIDLSATHKVRGEAGDRFALALDDQAVMDHSTGLMWAADVSDEDLDWDAGAAYCRDFRLGGFDDWRYALIRERFDITDFHRHNPALPPQFKARGSCEWTGEPTDWTRGKTASSRSFWFVFMSYGGVGSSGAYNRARVRPVRVAVPAGQSRPLAAAA